MIQGEELYKEPLDRCYICAVDYRASGDVTVSGKVVFNTIITNESDCYSTSTGYYTCPEDGVYLCSFVYYSNNSSGTEGTRPVILKNNDRINMSNGPYGKPVSCCYYCNKGDTLCVSACSGYSFSFYAAAGHNIFTVCKID